MLGTREHSYAEITKKLASSGFSSETIEAVLDQLIKAGYQSDERFANLFSEQLLRKYKGPLAISAKLSSRGIDSSLARDAISAAITESGMNWAEVACEALLAKFSSTELALLSNPDGTAGEDGHEISAEQRQAFREEAQLKKAKYARFLNSRGFSSTDSVKAIRLVAETVSE